MASEPRKILAKSRICGGGSFVERGLYPNVITRANGKSCGSKSFGQHKVEVVQVFVA